MIRRLVQATIGVREHCAHPLPPGVRVRRGGVIPALGGMLAGMRGPAAAVTLGRTIVVGSDARLTDRLLKHELAHVEQWQRRPFSFPLLYTWYHARHGYRHNPFEIEAREAETAP